MKFEVDTSNTFGDMLRTKMWDGRTDGRKDGMTEGRTETITISPAAFSAGDNEHNKNLIRVRIYVFSLVLQIFLYLQIFECSTSDWLNSIGSVHY